jgi:LemA protein
MGASLLGLAAAAGAAAFVLLCAVALVYNSLIGRRNRVDNAFSTVDVMIKKRYDLIPNLVSTVEGYATHEREVLRQVTELRNKAITGGLTDNEKIEVNNQITGAIKTIFAVSENYPDLKANKNFLHLQATLTELEEQISAARRAFNAAVLELNNGVDMFPTSVVASMMRLKRRAFFQAMEGEKAVPGVKEGLGR